MNEAIVVSSHVARDFLQNSAYFNTPAKVVWEYVSNSLDAARDDVQPQVDVEVTNHEIRVADNGRGMSRSELGAFFQMHGENEARRRGRRVRGRFGTGKCAAFGIAKCLRITTVQGGLENVVELRRSDIDSARDGDNFPVRHLVADKYTAQESGTVIQITDFSTRRLDVDGVIVYVQKQMSRFHSQAAVWVNGQRCQYKEPDSIKSITLLPPDTLAVQIGLCPLTIKVSPVPLDDDTRGVAIYSNGILHETTLAGVDHRDRASQLFGDVDVAALEETDWDVPAFDNTRNNMLNRMNPLVTDLLSWIASELEVVRTALVEEARIERNTELAKRLAREAKRIAKLLNEDFNEQQQELELSRRASRRSGSSAISEQADEAGELSPGGGDEPTEWQQTGSEHGAGKHGDEAAEGQMPRPGPTILPGDEAGSRKVAAEGRAKRRSSAFSIEFESATIGHDRSRYDLETKTIYINLDHPQVAHGLDAAGGKSDLPSFRELTCEIATVEYAIALPYERYNRGDVLDAGEILADVKRTIDRVTKRLAPVLYTSER